MDICPDCGALIDKGFLECPVCEPEAYLHPKGRDIKKLRGATKHLIILDDAWEKQSDKK
jgi:hypothetical protein